MMNQNPGERMGSDPIASEKVAIERKIFFLDLKENQRGRFLKITEDVGGRRDTIMLPAPAFRDFLGRRKGNSRLRPQSEVLEGLRGDRTMLGMIENQGIEAPHGPGQFPFLHHVADRIGKMAGRDHDNLPGYRHRFAGVVIVGNPHCLRHRRTPSIFAPLE